VKDGFKVWPSLKVFDSDMDVLEPVDLWERSSRRPSGTGHPGGRSARPPISRDGRRRLKTEFKGKVEILPLGSSPPRLKDCGRSHQGRILEDPQPATVPSLFP
jgi:hypothetical protein